MSKQLKTHSFFLLILIFNIILLGIGSVIAQSTEETIATNTTEDSFSLFEENATTTNTSQETEGNETEVQEESTEVPSETIETNTTTTEETSATNTTEINQTETTNTIETNQSIQVQSISLEKITPVQISVGEQQLNIMVKNTGTISLFSVEAEVTGYGITTAEKISIEELPVGEKDYTFTKVFAEKAGTIDLIIKISSNGTLLLQEISVLEIVASAEEVVVEETEETEATEATEETAMNSIAATALLNETRNTYSEVEKEYYQKEKEDYIVYGVKEDLSEIKEFLREAQVALIEQDQKEFDKNILAAKTSIETLAADLATAEKEQKTWGEIISENLTLIGSLLGVFISAVTVWSITKAHLKNTRVVNIIKGKQILNLDKETKVENKQHSEK